MMSSPSTSIDSVLREVIGRANNFLRMTRLSDFNETIRAELLHNKFMSSSGGEANSTEMQRGADFDHSSMASISSAFSYCMFDHSLGNERSVARQWGGGNVGCGEEIVSVEMGSHHCE